MLALDHLGFGDYRAEAEEVVKDCKSKRRRQSTRLENLGIPEEELFRQQQELFAKVNILNLKMYVSKLFLMWYVSIFNRPEKNKWLKNNNNGKNYKLLLN